MSDNTLQEQITLRGRRGQQQVMLEGSGSQDTDIPLSTLLSPKLATNATINLQGCHCAASPNSFAFQLYSELSPTTPGLVVTGFTGNVSYRVNSNGQTTDQLGTRQPPNSQQIQYGGHI